MINTKYIKSGRYNPSQDMFIYYEKGTRNFWASMSGDKIEVCYGSVYGDCDYWDLNVKHKEALLAIVDKKGFDTKALLKFTRDNDLNKKEDEKNGLSVKLNLVGKDGNAFAILALFRKSAKRQGFTDEQIDPIIKEAKSGDYGHLLYTIQNNII